MLHTNTLLHVNTSYLLASLEHSPIKNIVEEEAIYKLCELREPLAIGYHH